MCHRKSFPPGRSLFSLAPPCAHSHSHHHGHPFIHYRNGEYVHGPVPAVKERRRRLCPAGFLHRGAGKSHHAFDRHCRRGYSPAPGASHGCGLCALPCILPEMGLREIAFPLSQGNNNHFVIIALGFFFFLLTFLPDEAFSSFLSMILPETYCFLLLDRFFTQACVLCLFTLLIAGRD